jgi:hypothetical protein
LTLFGNNVVTKKRAHVEPLFSGFDSAGLYREKRARLGKNKYSGFGIKGTLAMWLALKRLQASPRSLATDRACLNP